MKKTIALLAAAALLACACVKVDKSLGKSLVDKSLIFDTYTVEFPLEEISLQKSKDLSAFSDKRMTIGAIRDETFGLTTREAAFALIPVLDTLDFGTNPTAVDFALYFALDSVSVADDSQKRIIQNLLVTELLERVPTKMASTSAHLKHGTDLITNGIPTFNGSGAISIKFTQEYAQKYVDAIHELGPVLKDRENVTGEDKYDEFVDRLPGIHVTTDIPDGIGGRINLFQFSCLSVESNYYRRNNNIGILKVHSTWDGVQKDSTFMFLPGETEFEDEQAYLDANTKFYQYSYNTTTHSTESRKPEEFIFVEGGGGLKPVIRAKELQEKTRQAIIAKGGDPDKATIIKASIELPFEMPDNYRELEHFPTMLSPTIRTVKTDDEGNDIIAFAGLTDASVSTENQGDIDRSNLCYSPDITYHMQELLTRTDLDTATDADIWLLTIHTEKVAEANGSAYDNEYYRNLMYASYYNSIYGNGYGYGGYGGYGYNNYSNYYSYMMMAQMMASSTEQSYTYTSELDKDRYYKAVLNGPEITGDAAPLFRVTFAIPEGD